MTVTLFIYKLIEAIVALGGGFWFGLWLTKEQS